MKQIIFFSTIILALLSCHKQADPTTVQGETEVSMIFSNPQRTRSEGTASEKAIKQVDILVFDGANVDAENAVFLYSRYAWNKQEDTYKAILKIGAHLDIYVAVNVRDLIDNGQIVAGMKWSQVREKLLLTNPNLIDPETVGLPMWGYIYDYTIKDQPANHLGTIKLLRAVSSADITVSATNFMLDKGHMVFGANKGSLPFSPLNLNDDFTVKVPEIPADMEATTQWSYVDLLGEKQIVNRFYMYDNDAPTGDKRHTKIILEGRWSGSVLSQNTFYPLAFRDQTTGDKLKVIRNTKYMILVTNVNGDGFTDLELAKSGDDVNMEYQVIPWDDNLDGDVIIDGPSFFALPSKRSTLYRNLGSVSEIILHTSYSLDDIKISFEQGVAGVSGVIESHPRFRAEVLEATNAQGTYTCFRFTAKQAYGTSDNPATLFVTAGRIGFKIFVEQINRIPNDWENGGRESVELE